MLRTETVTINWSHLRPGQSDAREKVRDDDDEPITMSKRQAAILAAKLRHPAGKAIPPSPEVQRWADQESRDRFRAEHDGNRCN
jgi:hypothetical protein